jgi:hypothetical protein
VGSGGSVNRENEESSGKARKAAPNVVGWLVDELGLSHDRAAHCVATTMCFEEEKLPALKRNHQALVKALGLTPDEQQKLALQAGLVFSLAPHTVCERLIWLASEFEISPLAARKMAMGTPRILTATPELIRRNLKALEKLFPTSNVRQKGIRKPELLLYAPESMARNMAGISRHLIFNDTQSAAFFRKSPDCALISAERVALFVDTVSRQLRVPKSDVAHFIWRGPQMLRYSPEHVVGKVGQLASVLRVSKSVVGRMIHRSPELLINSVESLDRNLKEISAAMSWTRKEAVDVAQRYPLVLKRQPERLVTKILELAAELGLSREDTLALIYRQPQLVSMAPSSVGVKAQLVLDLGQVCGESLTMQDVAQRFYKALCRSDEFLRLLIELAQSGNGPAKVSSYIVMSIKTVKARLAG